MKKTISVILTAVLVITSLMLVPTGVSAYSSDRILIKDTNKWENFYYYIWDEYGNEMNNAIWPGTRAEKVLSTDDYNLYEISLDFSFTAQIPIGIVVSGGSSLQADYYYFEEDGCGFTITNETNELGQFMIEKLAAEEITSDPALIRDLKLKQKPKTTYHIGEAFDPAGMELCAEYYGGISVPVDNYTLEGFDTTRTGTRTVKLFYTSETGKTFVKIFDITVEEEPEGIEITQLPYQTSCIVGGYFNLNGLEVCVVKKDGAKEPIPMMPNPNTPKTVWVTNSVGWRNMAAVARDQDGTQKTVMPSDSMINGFGEETYSFVFPSTTRCFYIISGEKRTSEVFDLEQYYYINFKPLENGEWELVGWYSNYNTDDESDGYTLSLLEKRAGRQTVTVTYHEYTATFEVDVFDKGDVNRDFSLNVVDVTAIQKNAAELMTFDEFEHQLADVNNDGVCDVTDATVLQLLISET